MNGGKYLMLKSKLLSGASIATVSIAMTIPAQAQSAIDEVVVTAEKGRKLAGCADCCKRSDESHEIIDVFSDYPLQMPGITAGGSGPYQTRFTFAAWHRQHLI